MEVIVCQTEQSRYLFDEKTIVVAFYAEIYGALKIIDTQPRCRAKLSH
jgi:hypothetical protein